MIDLDTLTKAIETLAVAVGVYDRNPLPPDAPERALLRDGVIQRFEYTFDLSWKTLKRHLEHFGLERVDALGSRDLFRVGAEQGLLESPERWFHYLHMRNQTSHVYNNAKADEVFRSARDFLPDAQILLARLDEKNR